MQASLVDVIGSVPSASRMRVRWRRVTVAAIATLLAVVPAGAIALPRAAPRTVAQAAGAGPGGASAAPSSTVRSIVVRRGNCDPARIDALVDRAADQYRAGTPGPALATIGQVLGCRHDPRIIRLAATYACAAKDTAMARLFYAMLAPQYRPAVVQRCQQENIALPGPAPGPASQPRVGLGAMTGVSCDAAHLDELMYDAADRFMAGDAAAALALADQTLACRPDVRMLRLATVYACVAHDDSAQRYYSQLPAPYRRAVHQRCLQENIQLSDAAPVVTAASATASAAPTSAPPVCASINADDLMLQAAHQFAAGFSRAASLLAARALACKQDPGLYRAATLYACVSRDLVSAKRYIARVLLEHRPALVQRCRAEGLDVTTP